MGFWLRFCLTSYSNEPHPSAAGGLFVTTSAQPEDLRQRNI
jgi:hypothetical protein